MLLHHHAMLTCVMATSAVWCLGEIHQLLLAMPAQLTCSSSNSSDGRENQSMVNRIKKR